MNRLVALDLSRQRSTLFFCLHYIDGMTYRAIGRRFGIGAQLVSYHVWHRGYEMALDRKAYDYAIALATT